MVTGMCGGAQGSMLRIQGECFCRTEEGLQPPLLTSVELIGCLIQVASWQVLPG